MLAETISLSILEEMFGPPTEIQPYGKVVVVPGDKFDPDWEALLEHQCVFTEINNSPVTLVKVESTTIDAMLRVSLGDANTSVFKKGPNKGTVFHWKTRVLRSPEYWIKYKHDKYAREHQAKVESKKKLLICEG
jgi:hypothetical protein